MSSGSTADAPDRHRALLRDKTLLVLLALSTMTVMAGAVVAPILPDLLEPLKTDGARIGFVATTHSLLRPLPSGPTSGPWDGCWLSRDSPSSAQPTQPFSRCSTG